MLVALCIWWIYVYHHFVTAAGIHVRVMERDESVVSQLSHDIINGLVFERLVRSNRTHSDGRKQQSWENNKSFLFVTPNGIETAVTILGLLRCCKRRLSLELPHVAAHYENECDWETEIQEFSEGIFEGHCVLTKLVCFWCRWFSLHHEFTTYWLWTSFYSNRGLNWRRLHYVLQPFAFSVQNLTKWCVMYRGWDLVHHNQWTPIQPRDLIECPLRVKIRISAMRFIFSFERYRSWMCSLKYST